MDRNHYDEVLRGVDSLYRIEGESSDLLFLKVKPNAVHLPRRADIAGTDARDAERCDLRLLHDAAKGDVRGDDKLAPRIRAVQVLRWVDLGVAESLRLTQGIFEFQPGRRHGVEDIIRRSVHDPADTEHRLHIERALQIRQPADTAADGRGAAQRDMILPGKLHQLAITLRHKLLVRRDDVLARTQRGAHIFIGRLTPTHALDGGIHRRIRDDPAEV